MDVIVYFIICFSVLGVALYVPGWIADKLLQLTDSFAVFFLSYLAILAGEYLLYRYFAKKKEKQETEQRRKREAEEAERAKQIRDAKIREIYGQDFFELSEAGQQKRIQFVDERRKRLEELRKEQERQRRLEEERRLEEQERQRRLEEKRRLEELERQRHLREVERRRCMERQAAETKARIEREDRERAEKMKKSARPACYPNGCSTCNRDCPFDL